MDTAVVEKHLIELKEMAAKTGADVSHLNDKVQEHIEADERKFKDLYERSTEHDRFRSHIKGGTLTLGGLLTLSGLLTKMKGWW